MGPGAGNEVHPVMKIKGLYFKQIVREATRFDKILDLILVEDPTIIKRHRKHRKEDHILV
jgi:hypothetical protein